jgi:hypothetical protein
MVAFTRTVFGTSIGVKHLDQVSYVKQTQLTFICLGGHQAADRVVALGCIESAEGLI